MNGKHCKIELKPDIKALTFHWDKRPDVLWAAQMQRVKVNPGTFPVLTVSLHAISSSALLVFHVVWQIIPVSLTLSISV